MNKPTKLKTIKTPLGNDIDVIDLSITGFLKTVLIIGVFHGEEPDGEYLIRRFLDNVETLERPVIKNRLVFIPCLNPDGKLLNKRTNSGGVDLNRNFPSLNWERNEEGDFYSGDSPASENETKFIMELIEDLKPDVILTLHEPYRIVNYDGPAKEIAQKISQITGYPVQNDIGYPTPGSFGTYYGVERTIPVITVELPEKQPKEALWDENKGMFEYFSRDFY